ncbi:unnamed protein product [Lactuca virosa]|uniref:Uncharacterized protein n=1 Tax=Lactuca virosa TaxID=75947 RepID=A0AAU9LYN9_9ASTR|nr:unnamed protein product [Lactuca virosa]
MNRIWRIHFASDVEREGPNKKQKKDDIVVSSSKDTTSSSAWPWQKMVENLKLAHQKLPVIIDLINIVHRSEQVGIGDPNYGGKYYKTMEKPDYLKFEVAQLGESKTFDEGFHGAYLMIGQGNTTSWRLCGLDKDIFLTVFFDISSSDKDPSGNIGSSPGFEDGEFESSKIIHLAALFYHNEDDSLYLVDSENHAIRRADMESKIVETLYPKPNVSETKSGLVSWIIDNIWSTNDIPSNSEEVDPKLLFYPCHLLKSLENDLFILNRSFQTLWILDLSSGIIKEVVKGSAKLI